jgi:hypothetical protein
MSVSKVKNNILAVKNGVLSVLSPQLQVLSEFAGLNYPYSVTGVEAFPIDIDNDGNLGSIEDKDGDSTTAMQETFDLALVSTNEGVVVFNVTKPSSPEKIALIPGAGGRLVVDRARRLVYTTSGPVISLNDLKPNDPAALKLKDSNGDGKDDRILGMIQGIGAMDMVSDDSGTMAYLADYSAGKVEVVNLGPEIQVLDDNNLAADEIKFGDGSKAEKRYKLRLVGMDNSASCATLTGKIRAMNANGVITNAGAGYYPPEYNLYFEMINGKCVVKLVENNVPKEKFIVLNMSEAALIERLSELRDVYGVSVDFSKTAILYGGIGNKVEVEIGRMKREVSIEPVGVIVLGIDGLRQDVLYPPALDDVKDPNGSYYVDPFGLGGLGQILKGNPQEPLSQRYTMLPKVTAIFPSITFASWASIFTGKMPKDTGITGNEFFARDLYNQATPNNQAIPGMSPLPSGTVTLDADGGAFRPLEKRFFYSWLSQSLPFALSYVMPAEWSPFPGQTLQSKLEHSAAGNALPKETKPLWSEMNTLVSGKYQTSANSNDRCDQTSFECRTVSMFNQYAEGADWWGTPASPSKAVIDALLKNGGSLSASLMDNMSMEETVDFIKSYFKKNAPNGKRKRFPAVLSIYLPGIDHYAHAEGMNGYANYFRTIADVKIAQIVKALKDQGEFDNKIFIIVADHGHTEMPTDLKYKKTMVSIDPESGTSNTWLQDATAEMSCELKTNFQDNPKEPYAGRNAREAERNNNNLHIWELGTLFTNFAPTAAGIRLLAPAELNRTGVNITQNPDQANVITALNGPMAHIYVKGVNWQSNPDETRLGVVLDTLIRVLTLGENATDKVKKELNGLTASVDKILVRRTLNGSYEIVTGVSEGASGNVNISTAALTSLSNAEYPNAVTRITGMNHKDRSGDVILLMKDATNGATLERYTTAYACKSWHGSLNKSDSYVPFVVAYPGGNKLELDPILNSVCPSNNCDGNWKLSDLIKKIVRNQYSGQ